jgi:phage anti-repressor protein
VNPPTSQIWKKKTLAKNEKNKKLKRARILYFILGMKPKYRRMIKDLYFLFDLL